ncbi:MAG: stage II sporulation protein M [Clostridia bacterium]|nr:stage II sporulation protein M [Clostridia bacterium]
MKRHRQKKFRNILLEHIKNNTKEYTILLSIFIIGIIIGVLLINHTSNNQRLELSNYIYNYVSNFDNCKDELDNIKILNDSIINNSITFLVLWIVGLTATLTPIIYGMVLFKGLCLGYTMSTIIGVLGVNKGLVFAISLLLPQNLILIPAILAMALSGIIVHTRTSLDYNERIFDRKKKYKESLKHEIIRHSAFSIIIIFFVIISCFVEAFISINAFKWVSQFIQN